MQSFTENGSLSCYHVLIFISVEFAPKVLNYTAPEIITYNQRVNVTCIVIGNPYPRISTLTTVGIKYTIAFIKKIMLNLKLSQNVSLKVLQLNFYHIHKGSCGMYMRQQSNTKTQKKYRGQQYTIDETTV